ncbi:MAG: 50S ribosomal protein L29 [Coxiellaceae bacterium]|jgi:ribosomal protein L29|nr:50S ribosomal protein L29 [Coxiellaceae bacterium]
MKLNELKTMSHDELITELAALQKEQFSLRLQKKNVGMTQANAPRVHSFKQIRRKIAYIKTILNEKVRESHE